jgi:hypothetical protein
MLEGIFAQNSVSSSKIWLDRLSPVVEEQWLALEKGFFRACPGRQERKLGAEMGKYFLSVRNNV